jgi:hypothetical protein
MIIAALSLLAHFDARMVFQLTAAYSARCRERQSEQAFGGVWPTIRQRLSPPISQAFTVLQNFVPVTLSLNS